MNDLLKKGLDELKIDHNEDVFDKIDKFYDLLIEKNKVMNLTRITDKDDFIIKHILDSLLICKFINISDQYIIDVGTGAGFPGLPIKIFFPNTKIVLMDSLNKRLTFINEVIDKLELDRITTVHARAEDLGQNFQYREKFDLVVSRAVANLSVLSEFCIPFVKKGGSFISYKSNDSVAEISQSENAICTLSGSISEVQNINLPFSDITRKIIIIDKINNTPKNYPRKSGVPTKYPL